MGRIAIVGAGWSGLSAAVHALAAGHEVALFEMAHRGGGRARSLDTAAGRLDNGQHILIGAYRDTLALMRHVGVDLDRTLHRMPLTLRYPDGLALALRPGPAAWAFASGVLRSRRWPVRDRVSLLATTLAWRWRGFRCRPEWTVAQLCQPLPQAIVDEVIEPLCVAALNTPIASACGQTFLRVLREALFGGPGSADLLLPKAPLSELLPEPASRWLDRHGAQLRWGRRVQQIRCAGGGWLVDDEHFDAVVIATSAREASRLVESHDVQWSLRAAAVGHQPIVTVWLRDPALHWPSPMMALRANPDAPAQFGFDVGALGGPQGCFSFVVSGAAQWIDRGLPVIAAAVLEQARAAFPGAFVGTLALHHIGGERRATFACIPGLNRPRAWIAEGLVAAGDYVDGPYPATLEGSVRSGRQAIERLQASTPGGT